MENSDKNWIDRAPRGRMEEVGGEEKEIEHYSIFEGREKSVRFKEMKLPGETVREVGVTEIRFIEEIHRSTMTVYKDKTERNETEWIVGNGRGKIEVKR